MSEIHNPERHRGKVAIVTGAGQGIGEGVAHRLAREGAHIVVAEINPDTVYAVAEELSNIGPEALAYLMDVGDVDQINQMVTDVVAHFGRIDILVNNAGVSEKMPFLKMTPERWDNTQRVNQRGLFFCLQAVTRQMIGQIPAEIQEAGKADRSYGKIVNLSSVTGRRGRADAIHYAVSKSSVISITQGTAAALGGYGINVNAICPSVVPTPMWEELDRQQSVLLDIPIGEFYRSRIEKIPLKRAGTLGEIAAMVSFLCSDEADYITGQAYNVDGGSAMN
jgi:meso-butanediol dehydrogenase / (S,S)-butanediol dehydrogenase / diacetyl reductase